MTDKQHAIEETKVQGVVAIFIDDEGRSMFAAHDFSKGGAAGFTEKERQKIRARDKISQAVVEGYASPMLSRAMTGYYAQNVVNDLVNSFGCKIVFHYIGYEGEE